MKFTLAQKREIVTRFKAGESCYGTIRQNMGIVGDFSAGDIEQVIRSFMRGEFTVPRWFRVKKCQ